MDPVCRFVCECCPAPAVLSAAVDSTRGGPVEAWEGFEPLKLCVRCLGITIELQKDRGLVWRVESLATKRKPYTKPEIRELSPDDPRVRSILDELEPRK